MYNQLCMQLIFRMIFVRPHLTMEHVTQRKKDLEFFLFGLKGFEALRKWFNVG